MKMRNSPMALSRYALYEDIATYAEKFAIDNGLNTQQCQRFANGIVEVIAREFGGQLISFPKNLGNEREIRDLEIYQKRQSGTSICSLVKEYQLSSGAIYKVCQRVELKKQLQPEG